MKKKIVLACILTLFLVACGRTEELPTLPTLDPTRLQETAISQFIADYTKTQAAIPTKTLTPTSTTTPIPTIDRTRPPIFTPTGVIPCNRAKAGNPIDVTIPDGTVMDPGKAFSKTWRLENVGSCTWTRLYSVMFFSGNSLGARYTHNLMQPVEPGQLVDITIDMIAPNEIGLYQSNWMISDAGGELFGIGPHGDAPFWVRIEVVRSIESSPTPAPSTTPAPIIQVAGSATLGNDDQIDLDRGTLNPEEENEADLIYHYRPGNSPLHRLSPINGARWAAVGNTVPNLEACKQASLGSDSLNFDEIPYGTYFCYQTSKSLFGWLLIEKFEDNQLTISFLTWATP